MQDQYSLLTEILQFALDNLETITSENTVNAGAFLALAKKCEAISDKPYTLAGKMLEVAQLIYTKEENPI